MLDFEDLSKKRKWQEPHVEETFHKRSNTDTPKSPFDIELHLETPLPLEWQRCLDIQVNTYISLILHRLCDFKVILNLGI